MPPQETLGKLQLDVLRFVTDQKSASVREVAQHFATTSGQARTTVLTVLEKLREKKYVRRAKSGGVYRYSPTISKPELLRQLVGDFVDDVLRGSASPFVAYLSQSKKLTADEARKLEQLLKQIENREQQGDQQ
jgi:predicted transcriptional regulator